MFRNRSAFPLASRIVILWNTCLVFSASTCPVCLAINAPSFLICTSACSSLSLGSCPSCVKTGQPNLYLMEMIHSGARRWRPRLGERITFSQSTVWGRDRHCSLAMSLSTSPCPPALVVSSAHQGRPWRVWLVLSQCWLSPCGHRLL